MCLIDLVKSRCSPQTAICIPVLLRTLNGASLPRPSLILSASRDQTVAVVIASSMKAEVTLSSSLSAADSRTLIGLLSGPADVRFIYTRQYARSGLGMNLAYLEIEPPWVHERLEVRVGQVEVADGSSYRCGHFKLQCKSEGAGSWKSTLLTSPDQSLTAISNSLVDMCTNGNSCRSPTSTNWKPLTRALSWNHISLPS